LGTPPPKRLLVTANTTKTNVGISLDLILLAKDGPVAGLSEKIKFGVVSANETVQR